MIGIVLLFNCLANMLGSFVAGWAYDHFNPYYLIMRQMTDQLKKDVSVLHVNIIAVHTSDICLKQKKC